MSQRTCDDCAGIMEHHWEFARLDLYNYFKLTEFQSLEDDPVSVQCYVNSL